MRKLLALLIAISIFIIPMSGYAADVDVCEGIRLGESRKTIIQQLRNREIWLNNYGIYEDKVAGQPYSIIKLFFLKDLSNFEPVELDDFAAWATDAAHEIAFDVDFDMIKSGYGGLMDPDVSADEVLVQVKVIITADYKYETAGDTFKDVEEYLTQKYGDTRYTSRRGQSLPMVKGYDASTYFVVTKEIQNILSEGAYKTVPDYSQRIVDLGNGLFLVIDHHISISKANEGYEFSHKLVYSLIPIDISNPWNIMDPSVSQSTDAIAPKDSDSGFEDELEIGKTINFGRYANSDIEWIVIDKEGAYSLLLSKDIIDHMCFSEYRIVPGWENSSLRAWLNGSFLQSAFSKDELSAIHSFCNNDVIDSVFLLNKSQIEEYSGRITDYNIKTATSTEYALDQLTFQVNAGNFWLVDYDEQSIYPSQPYVDGEGNMSYSRSVAAEVGVRPAVWVKTAAVFGEEGEPEIKYQMAAEEIENKKYCNAMHILATMPDYKDSDELLATCRKELYEAALQLQDKGNFAEALAQFQNLEDYEDSSERRKDCFIDLLKPDFDKAVSLMDSEEYQEASKIFLDLKLKGYDGASAMYNKCEEAERKKPENEQKYKEAVESMKNGEYSAAISTFRDIIDYSDSAEKIRECKYLQACDLIAQEQFNEAYVIFSQIRDYKNVSEMIDNTPELSQASLDTFSLIGSVVTFGSYEQDNNESNGKETLEWIVLDVRNGKSLLMSRKIIAAMVFSYDENNVKWEDSNIRVWLNDSFVKNAFDENERSLIKETRLRNDQGSNTDDFLFLIAGNELYKIIIKEDVEKADCTGVAAAEYMESNSSLNNWWLRSCFGKNVEVRGGSALATSVTKQEGVRPCLWIKVDNIVKKKSSEDNTEGINEKNTYISGDAVYNILSYLYLGDLESSISLFSDFMNSPETEAHFQGRIMQDAWRLLQAAETLRTQSDDMPDEQTDSLEGCESELLEYMLMVEPEYDTIIALMTKLTQALIGIY